MTYICCRTAALRGERGSILFLTSIVLLGLLTFAGLAIDAGNLYRAQLAAQNAADTSALAIVNYINIQGKIQIEQDAAGGGEPDADREIRQDAVSAFLFQRVEDLARTNMAKSGWPHSNDFPVTVDADYRIGTPSTVPNDPSFAYTVTVDRPVSYLLMDKIPLINRKVSNVHASATSDRKIANVAIMLDVSGSLNCPSVGDCSCLLSGTCPNDVQTKYDDLVIGVREFIKMFDLENDNISLIAYNLGAKTLSMASLRSLAQVEEPITEEDIDKIADVIHDAYTPSGPTNICDGIMEAAATMARVSPDETVAYVLFSDGAPTAARFLFADVNTANLRETTKGLGRYDYSMYNLDWLRPAADVLPGESKTISGPSLLLQAGALASHEDGDIGQYFLDPSAPPRDPSSEPVCDDGLTRAPQVVTKADLNGAVTTVLSRCVNSMKSHVPGDEQRTYGSEYAASGPGAKMDWRRQYYHCAIELADSLRMKQQATFYTLGLGDPPTGVLNTDPYGNIDDTGNRKDTFLARLTFDIIESNKLAPVDKDGAPARPKFDYQEYRDYSDLPSGSRLQYGLYLPTHKPAELRLMFHQIARKVLLRLIG